MKIIAETESLCPYCLGKIPARYIEREGQIFLQKECAAHGAMETLFWRDAAMYHAWTAQSRHAEKQAAGMQPVHGCPFDCGLCTEHEGGVCTAILEITYRCNLDCGICFADATHADYEPNLQEIEKLFRTAQRYGGKCSIQLSGGEPTVRGDLPEIIRLGKSMGFPHIQVNTNGLRLAESPTYAQDLKNAGADLIYLQFDAADDRVYERIRGRKLLAVKIAAIENCRKAGLGVLLVPTIIPDVNLDMLGDIIDFAKANMPVVKGIHFQPVSYFGRYGDIVPENDKRCSLSDVIHGIEQQTGGEIKIDQLVPRQRFDPHCAFSGVFYLTEKGALAGITKNEPHKHVEEAVDYAANANKFTNALWRLHEANPAASGGSLMGRFRDRLRNHTLSITGMGFQDAWNIDLGRLRGCCVHVIGSGGRSIPLCAFHVTSVTGERLYRNE